MDKTDKIQTVQATAVLNWRRKGTFREKREYDVGHGRGLVRGQCVPKTMGRRWVFGKTAPLKFYLQKKRPLIVQSRVSYVHRREIRSSFLFEHGHFLFSLKIREASGQTVVETLCYTFSRCLT